MIVTVTPNPSIDRTIAVDAIHRGEVHRATSSRIDPGGKGVNISRALTAQGAATVAVLPAGGPEGLLMAELLDAAGVVRVCVPVAGGSLRMNVAVVEPDGTTTKLNEPGPTLSAAEVDQLLEVTLARARDAAAVGESSWVVGSGSLPPGAPDTLYAGLVTRAREAGLRVAIDSSGAPFGPAVSARPHLIKPNHEELAELVGRELTTLGQVRDAAYGLVENGIETVVVSLGGDGALWVDPDTVLHARASIDTPLSTVGAGDCLLAGLIDALTGGADPAAALTAGVTWGAAAVRLPGSQVPTPADLADLPVRLTDSPNFDLQLS